MELTNTSQLSREVPALKRVFPSFTRRRGFAVRCIRAGKRDRVLQCGGAAPIPLWIDALPAFGIVPSGWTELLFLAKRTTLLFGSTMANKDIVVIGASAGGIEALRVLVGDLPKDLQASLFIVLHIAASSPNLLHRILNRAGPLPASIPEDGEPIKPGRIYVARADHHLLLEQPGRVRLTRGPKENRFRPAIDPLLRSAAQAFGPRVVGIILTGFLDDGTAGLWAVKERGGTAIVQNPEEAVAPSMPLNALKHVEVDHCLELKKIPPLIARLAQTPARQKGAKPVSKEMETEVKIAREENALDAGIIKLGEPSLYACPECHGVLLQIKEGSTLRFRCHTGHAYSLETLLSEFDEQTEHTLWNAIRSLEETVLLMRRMASQLREHQHTTDAAAVEQKAKEAEERANRLREIVLHHEKHQTGPRTTAASLKLKAG
jgi:two-component system, chemotaxis family, protein-glutamate methylesterase/glutaminase